MQCKIYNILYEEESLENIIYKIKKINIYNLLLIICLSLYLFKVICNDVHLLIFPENSRQDIFYNMILWSILFLLMISRKYKKKEILIVIFYNAMLFYFYTYSKTLEMIFLFNFICATKNFEFNKIVKYDIWIKIILISLNLTCIAFGFIENRYIYKGTIQRYCLGFEHPNMAAVIIASIVMEIYYLKNNFKVMDFGIIGALSIIINMLLDSRGSIYLLIFFAMLAIIPKFNVSRKILPFLPGLFSIISLILIHLFNLNNPVVINLNKILSNRIYYASEYLKLNPINFFGNNSNSLIYAFDFSYIRIFYIHGFFIGLLFVLALTILFIKLKNNKLANVNNIAIKLFIAYCVYGLVESYAWILASNIFLLLLSRLFDPSKNKKKEDMIIKNK